jgi:hypothetical protein
MLALAFVSGCTRDSQEADSVQEPTYSLRTNFHEYTNDELDVELFEEVINSFDPGIWDFMVLSPDTPIKDSTYIQVGAPDEITDFQFTLEIGFNKNDELIVYRLYTKDAYIVLKYFADYWQEQTIPDISKWEDISKEVR